MNHTSLKLQIKIAQATTRLERSDAYKNIHQGRKLRKRAVSEKDATKAARLRSEGLDCYRLGISLRKRIYDSDQDRRHMHLAAALLNGRAYNQCEKVRDSMPNANAIGAHMALALPPEEQKHANYIAEAWLKDGAIRLSLLREQGLVRLIDQDKKMTEIAGIKVEIAKAEQNAQVYRAQVARTEGHLTEQRRMATKAEEKYQALQQRCDQMEAELRHEREAHAAKDAITQSIDDLFDEAA